MKYLVVIFLVLFNYNVVGQIKIDNVGDGWVDKVNQAIIAPTKSRILLGGILVKLISFAKEPPYKTPQLIECCRYTNPFEKKSHFNSPDRSKFSLNNRLANAYAQAHAHAHLHSQNNQV